MVLHNSYCLSLLLSILLTVKGNIVPCITLYQGSETVAHYFPIRFQMEYVMKSSEYLLVILPEFPLISFFLDE